MDVLREYAKAIAAAITTIVLWAIGLAVDLPEPVELAVGALITAGVVAYVRNRKPRPEYPPVPPMEYGPN